MTSVTEQWGDMRPLCTVKHQIRTEIWYLEAHKKHVAAV